MTPITFNYVQYETMYKRYITQRTKEINKMTKLEQFVKDRLDTVKCTSDTEFQEKLFHQAFGAVEFACLLYPKHKDEIALWWNDNKRDEFWNIIGG